VTERPPTFAEAFGVDLRQAEADFVVPNLTSDIPVCIDPFLLYKSRDPFLRDLHERVLGVFRRAFELHGRGDRAELDRLIDFPEVNAIGFGYTRGGIAGSGLGWHLNRLLADLLGESEEIRERGLRHIEELQLLSVGVGPDRVSDIAANILKLPLAEYTQQQCALWGIPLTARAPLAHALDHADMEWLDGYHDLPVNPLSGQPMLLVPRRVTRLLPWINYDDFYNTEALLLLPARPKLPRYPGMPKGKRLEIAKAEMVSRLRQNTGVLDRYVARKETAAGQAVPLLHEVDETELRTTADDLLARLDQIPIGAAASGDYQRIVYEILNFLFAPDLTGGEFEVRTYLGTERRDLVYWNEAEASFWKYARETYMSPQVMFEVKNVDSLEIDHINQTAAYLGARLGMLGFAVTRKRPSNAVVRKIYSVYNDTVGVPRKVILVLADADLHQMVSDVAEGRPATPYVQQLYRAFRSGVQ
jgi:hypothetical protein